MKHYVYLHTRLDKNEVFYIGIGTKSKRLYKTHRSIYLRAYRKDRNIIWQRIVQKTDYKVDIIFESDDYEQVKLKEKELIKLYGKKWTNGTLCNITDGGDGTSGIKRPKGAASKFSKKVYQYNLEGSFLKEWSCAQDIERELGIKANSICNCCNKFTESTYKTCGGYQWRYTKQNKLKPISRYSTKVVYQLDLDKNLIKKWNSVQEAADTLNIKKTCIQFACIGRLKTYKKFIWTY